MRNGLLAAGLLLAFFALLAPGFGFGGTKAAAATQHVCSATDRAFINTAQVNITSLGLWADQYKSGDAKASDVIREAQDAAKVVLATDPADPSLLQTRALLNSMFNEYARAVAARSKKKDAAPHLVRAYGLASFAHDVLLQAAPALKSHGCDVSPLL
jgi:hypothetical protein